MSPAAPVNRTRFIARLLLLVIAALKASAGLTRPQGKLAVALETLCQVRAHGATCLGTVAVADGVGDAPVLLLNTRQVAVLLGGGRMRRADAVSRDHVLAEEGQQLPELWVHGGIGNGAMKSKILSNGAVAARDRRVDVGERLHNGGNLPAFGALGG